MHPALLRYAWRLTGEESSAADVVQEAFLKLWQRRATLDPQRSLKALLYTTVRNLSLNHLRNTRRRHDALAEAARYEPDDGVAEDERLDAALLGEQVRAWIDAMPERRKEAFMLSRFQGLSHQEIADVMNLTPRTVNTHIVLALKHLRTCLGALESDHTAL